MRIVLMKRVAEVIWRRRGRRRSDEAFLDKMEKFRRNSSARYHMPEDQSLKLKLLPLGQAEVAPHP